MWSGRDCSAGPLSFQSHIFSKCFFLRLIFQVERNNAEIELALNKLKTEEASLRDQLAKMQALNEGLGQDKIDLQKAMAEVSEIFCGRLLLDSRCARTKFLLVSD